MLAVDSYTFIGESPVMPFTLGEKHWFKLRSETNTEGVSTYSLKVWQGEESDEPNDWTLVAVEDSEDQRNGSFMLTAHNADVSFGTVRVVPIP